MTCEVFEVLQAAPLVTVQDKGRLGYRHLGIPPSGAMDRGGLSIANQLMGNPEYAPVLECLQGVRFRACANVQVALAGYGHARAWCAAEGDIIEVHPSLPGVWHTLALPGGVTAPHWLGSASVCPRAMLGEPLRRGQTVLCLAEPLSAWPKGIAERYPGQPREQSSDPIRIWPGPQWASFSREAQDSLISQTWRVSRHCDRSGYRLEGTPVAVPQGSLISEPVRIGSIQVPPDGQPIICLYDGPTVGGYAKIAVVDPDDLDRLVQNRPGSHLMFRMMR